MELNKQPQLNFFPEFSDQTQGDSLVLFAFEDKVDELIIPANLKLSEKIKNVLKKREFTAEYDQTDYFFEPDLDIDKYIFMGVGKSNEISLERIRRLSANGIKKAKESKATNVLIDFQFFFNIQEVPAELKDMGELDGDYVSKMIIDAGIHGILLSMYKFDRFKRDEKEDKLKTINIIGIPSKFESQITKAIKVAEFVNIVRDWGNIPANIGTPTYFAEETRQLAERASSKVYLELFDKNQIEEMGWSTFLSVSKGTEPPNEPKLIVLKNFEKEPDQNKLTVAIVGKGITFDTGGYSIKDSDGLFEMKSDMLGAAASICTFFAATELDLKVNLISITPFTPNLINGKASLPGDIIKSLSGLTVEILNTDAEGRLILADALTYADTFKPDYLIDLATLTGASVVALGHNFAGLFCRSEKMKNKLLKAGILVNERLWQLPLLEEHLEDIKSDVADVKNTVGREGGATWGAAFLSKFTTTKKWAHIDIAPVAAIYKSKPHVWAYHPVGATGFGVRLLLAFIEAIL